MVVARLSQWLVHSCILVPSAVVLASVVDRRAVVVVAAAASLQLVAPEHELVRT